MERPIPDADKQDRRDRAFSSESYRRIYRLACQIPRGQVATYGQIAFVAGLATARIVGYAMAVLPGGTDVPWHRVINSQGKISRRKHGGAAPEQRRRLEAEGVRFDATGRVDFQQVAWAGPGWQWLQASGYDLDTLVLKSQRLRRTGAWCRWNF